MTTIIGDNYKKYSCDNVGGCHNETQKFYGTIAECDEQARKIGWYISYISDKAYCPEHSPYNIK